MRTLAATTVAALAIALPAVALAERFNSSVSIHSSFSEDRIYGVVQSPVHKCENNRRIVLHYRQESKRGPAYTPADETRTNGLGEYEFEDPPEKRGNPLAAGDYRVRALRKEAGNDVCKAALSRTITLEGGISP